MNEDYLITRASELELISRSQFGKDITVTHVLFDDISAPYDALMTIFTDESDHMYAICVAPRALPLRDLKDYFKSAGLTPLQYYAPDNDEQYFIKRGREIFLNAYPGRRSWTEQEKKYYSSLASCPALLARIAPNLQEIRRFNEISGKWQPTYDHEDVDTILQRAAHDSHQITYQRRMA